MFRKPRLVLRNPGTSRVSGLLCFFACLLFATPVLAQPSGYTVTIDQDPINADNVDAVSFTVSGAPFGLTDYQYVFSDTSGPLPAVSGSGFGGIDGIFQVAGIDLSSLADGPITLDFFMSDGIGDGPIVSDTSTKDTAPPGGYTATIDQDPITILNQVAVSISYTGAEVGATYVYQFTSTGGGAPVSATGTITDANGQFTGIDLSGLVDGVISLSFTLTDPAGNVGTPVSDNTNKIIHTLSIDDVTQNEGDAGVQDFTFTVSTNEGPAVNPISFSVSTQDDTAAAGEDYTGLTNVAGAIAEGQESTSITVSVAGDEIAEPDEVFEVLLNAVSGANVVGGPGTGTILNDDVQTISIANVSQVEGTGGGTTAFNFAVTVDGGTALNDINFRIDTQDGTATEGSGDYTQLNNELYTIAAGATGTTVTVDVGADALPETDETFQVQIKNVNGANASAADTATGTILNDDLNSISIGDVSQQEGDAGQLTFEFPVTVNGGIDAVQDINFSFATQNGTASVGDGDFAAVSGAGTIPAGSNSTVINVPVNGDEVPELDETFSVVLSNPSGATIAQGTGTGTIENDDTNSISIDDVSQSEGTGGQTVFVFTVSVDAGIALNTITFEVSTQDGTATVADQDYEPLDEVEGQIAQGDTSATVEVLVNGDDDKEANETFQVLLENVDNASVSQGVGTGTILNDDACDAGDQAPAQTSVPTVFCSDETIPSLREYTNSTPPAGTVLAFSTSPNFPDSGALLTDTQIDNPVPGTYYIFYYDEVNDCSSPTLEITIEQNQTPILESAVGDAICDPGILSLTASGSIPNSNNDPSLNWYEVPAGGEPVFSGPLFQPELSQTTTYYVEAFANGCSSERVEVVATVVPSVTAGVPANGSACSDPQYGPVTRDLDEQLTGADAGTWTIVTDPSQSLVIGADNIVDFTGVPDGSYVFEYTTTGAQAPCTNESVQVSISVTNCDVDTDGDGLLDGVEAALNTDPNNPDTDGDGIDDGIEVGDPENPSDEDSDGIIDALDSNILDTDQDGVNDQQDPANEDPCIPDNSVGLCDTDGDGISDGDEIAGGSDPLDPCDPNLTPDCEPDPIDLQVVKTVTPELASIGQEITFAIDLENLSDSRVLQIEVGDLLESGFSYTGHTASLGQYDPVLGSWTVAELGPLAAARLTITAVVQEGGAYTNTAELLASFPLDANTENDASTVEVVVDLPEGVDVEVEKSARIGENRYQETRISPAVGSEVTFRIRATNTSREDDLTNVRIEDVLDAAFTYRSHQASSGSYDPQTGEWVIPSLLLGEQAELEITVLVPETGTFTNTASYLSSSPGDANPDNNESSVTVVVSALEEKDAGFVFNQFSPNGDGTNDFLKIRDIGSFPGNSIQIFNRYGQQVFEASDMTDDAVWDGTFEGTDAPEGTYYYILELGPDQETRKGWIQLIR